MKLFLRLFFFAALLQIGTTSAQTCTMSGTYKIGPLGNYTTLTLASAALRSNGMSGAVTLELMATYATPPETNINFAGIACLSETRTLTIRPEAGAADLVVSNSIGAPLIALYNARYVTIDGRAGGDGNTIALTLANYSANGNVVVFAADASFNTLKYLNIYGSTSSQTSGLVNFMGTALSITNGNNDNLISNCNFGVTGQSPANCIYSVGSAGKKNARNRVVNCNLKDFAVATSSGQACGIMLDSNNSAWEITGNSFYQSQAAFVAGTKTVAINVNDINSSGFLINNNFIGGTAPFCGGAPFFFNGGLRGIVMRTATSGYSDIQGNTIQNIEWLKYLNPDDFCGIVLLNGKLRCGTAAGNIIGSPILNASILARAPSYETTNITGISAGSSDGSGILDTVLINNNIIGGIKAILHSGTDFTTSNIFGIFLQQQSPGFIDISNNIIGSLSMQNSLENTTNGKTKGIFSQALGRGTFDCRAGVSNIITGNTISNLSGGAPRGIDVEGGKVLLKNNLVQKLANDATYNFPTIGISATYNCPGTSITGNTVRNIRGDCTGIFSDASNGLVIEGNFIHSFGGGGINAYLKGIHVYATLPNPPAGALHGNYKIRNNMIRFGLDSAGSPLTENYNVRGIEAPLDSTVITHNSVFLGGLNALSNNTNIYVSRIMNSGNRITNNILMNENTTAAFWFDPAALISFDDDILSLTGLFLNNNLYYGFAETYTAIYKNTQYRGLGLWRTVSGMEGNSIISNPNFANAHGNVNNVDLHLNGPTPAEAKGIMEPDVISDFDQETRATLSPADIGADAGNYLPYATENTPFALLCPGGNISLKTDVSNQYSWYQWQADTGAGFTNITDNSYYSGTTSSTLLLTGLPSVWYGFKYRGVINDVPGTVYTLKFENKWIGAIDNVWHNPANWSCGIIPDGNTDVIINSGIVLVNANGICRTLSLLPGVTFTVGTGVILTVTR